MIKKNCKYCNKIFLTNQRALNRGWGLCCTKKCAAKLREMSKPGYNTKIVALNNLRRENWNNYEEDEDPADDMYWSSKNY